MSVLIKGMEMPECCAECDVEGHYENSYGDEYGFFCPFGYKAYTEETRDSKRLDNCPLVPVPPHGDLIDRDALLDTATIHWSHTTNESCFPIDEIEYAPTVLPAEEDET